MNGIFKKVISIAIVFMLLFTNVLLVACDEKDDDDKKPTEYFDNEKDYLVFASQDVDGVFNPFFSTSGADSNVVGLTQIGMIGNDKSGNPVVGKDEAVIVLDYAVETVGTGDNQRTTYKFVLKNNVRFSNGSYLTIKDVLFNLYVYLDPAYTGSSTIYSTDIVGLKQYRTQEDSETEQDNFTVQFDLVAEGRISKLLEALGDINRKTPLSSLADAQELRGLLTAYMNENADHDEIVKDFDTTVKLFKEELKNDFSSAKDSYEDTVFTDEKGVIHRNLFTTDVEVFLYNEGLISWSKKEGKLSSDLTNNLSELKNYTEQQAIDAVFNRNIPGNIEEVIQYWATATELFDAISKEAMSDYFKNSGSNLKYPNISGIKFANGGAERGGADSVTVNGVTYATPKYADSNCNQVTEGNEVLSIEIHKIDPKAIWNFAFAVAPMYYYSDSEHIAKFDYVKNFGVERGSSQFMNEVVKANIGVPVGAGPYAASKASGGIENISDTDFKNNSVIYYERNPYYVMGPAKIKSIRYQVISATQQLNALYQNTVHFAEPNAKPDTIADLNSQKKNGIGNESIQTSGYGYIGINAGKVPNIKVRQAIMHAINTQECVDYYQTTAKAIYRSMSKSSWAYPDGCTPYYPYIGGPVPTNLTKVNPDYRTYVTKLGKKAGDYLTKTEQDGFFKYLIYDLAGYRMGGDGIYAKGNDRLDYEFAIAGQETDHPAYNAMVHAKEILERNGFKVNVKTRQDALKQLASGGLTVWAAAWGSTIDPDMYQVYHKDSTATSVLNWGYKQIMLNAGNKYSYEYKKVNELSKLIDEARKIDDSTPAGKAQRAAVYSRCLDMVMELAVELPTYQRDDLFAYNEKRIDVTTFTPENERSAFKGLTSDIHNVSLIVER